MDSIFSNASSTTYHSRYKSCYSNCLVLFLSIYCIIHSESTNPFSLVLLLGRFSYQLPISGPSIYIVILSATPLIYFYQHTVSTSPIIYLLKEIVPCTCIKSLITFWYQLLLSLTVIFFPNKILASVIPTNYSSVTIKFLFS